MTVESTKWWGTMRCTCLHFSLSLNIHAVYMQLPAVYISIWKAFLLLDIKKTFWLVTKSKMYSPTPTEHSLCMCLVNSGQYFWVSGMRPKQFDFKNLLDTVKQWKYVPSLKSRQVACSLFCSVSVGIWLSAGTVELSSKFASDHTGHFNRGGVLYSPVPDNWRQ